MIHKLKHHNVWLVGQTKEPQGLRIDRTGGPYMNSFNGIDWVDYQEIIVQLLQDNGKMRELLRDAAYYVHLEDDMGPAAIDAVTNIHNYINSLPK